MNFCQNQVLVRVFRALNENKLCMFSEKENPMLL